MLAASGSVKDTRNVLRNLRKTSERVRERSKERTRENSPGRAQVDPSDQRDEADAPPASRSVEDDGNWPRKLRKRSEHERRRLEPKEKGNSPCRPREEPYDPGGETAVPGGAHDVQERPRNIRDERVDGTDTPSRVIDSEGHLGDREKSEVVKGDPDHGKVVEGARYNGKRPKSIRDARDVEMNVLRRDGGPGGHRDKEDKSGGIGGKQERQSDGDGVEKDGTGCRMDGATSGARRNSKQVETRPLAGVETGQHRQCNHTTAHIPQPSTPPPSYARSLSDYVNPLRRRGRTKTKPRQISQTRARKLTHHFERSCRGRIG